VLGKLFRLGIVRSLNPLSSFCEIIRSMPKLDAGSKQEPISAWLAIGHADTAGVYNSDSADHAVKLHVRVPANHSRGVGFCEE